LLQCDDTAYDPVGQWHPYNAAPGSDFRACSARIRARTRKAAWGFNVRKSPTRFLDISGMGCRRSSYFPSFYNSTQFERDQERAMFCVGVPFAEQTFPKN
jgi:hypothetical protein